MSLSSETIQVWTVLLARTGRGLTFTESEDRVTFRCAVNAATRHCRVSILRDLALHFGSTRPGTSRYSAARALADAYMAYAMASRLAALSLSENT
jgi:hypothetical protein